MFSVNGHALDDPARGWLVLEDGTEPRANIEVELESLTVAGRDGVKPLPLGRVGAPVIPLVIETPPEGEQALRSLFRARTLVLTDDTRPGLEVQVERLSVSTFEDVNVNEVTVLLRLPGVYWRDDADDTTDPAALGSGSVALSVMAGLSAPVRDALVRVTGGASNLRVTDSEGSFFEYGAALPSGSFLRFDSETGRAWVTDTDTWSGGTAVTGLITTGPGPYPFELTPAFTNPDTRAAEVTVTTSARTGSPAIEFRGRRAYEV